MVLAAAALLALAAPAQAQTEVWTATFTPAAIVSSLIGCSNTFTSSACSNTAILSDDDFTYDSTDYAVTELATHNGNFGITLSPSTTTATAALTLVVDSTSLVFADADNITATSRIWNSAGITLTPGTAIDVSLIVPANAVPTLANVILDQTATAGTAFSYEFPANTFADTDTGDTLTYTATQSDDSALPSWLSFDAATRTFSGTPTAADVGTVSVKVTASDGTDSVSTPFDIVVSANNAPVFANDTAARSFTETVGDAAVSTAGNVGAVVTATDTDTGDTLTYSLEGTDAAKFGIVSGSGQIQTKVGEKYDQEAKASYSVTVKADDGNGGSDTIAVTITVDNAEEKPVAPTMPTVTATSGSTTSLDVSWAAPANTGRPAITGYKVEYRPGSSGSWTNHAHSGTGTTATIASLTAATAYQVQVLAVNADGDGAWSGPGAGTTNTAGNANPTFTDGTSTTRAFTETVGDATVSTAGNVGAVVTATDTDTGDTLTYSLEGADAAKFGIVSGSGQIQTKVGEKYDREAKASYSVAVKAVDGNGGSATIAVTISVDDAEEKPVAPAMPTVTATSGSTTSLDVSWAAPANTGRPAITGYKVEYRPGSSGSWTNHAHSGTGTTATIASLTAATSYQVQVLAVNADGDGAWSGPGSGTTGTGTDTAPTVNNVDVTSMPDRATSYGTGEMIQFTVTFDQAVTVTGTPEFEFCLGNSDGGSCTDGSPPPTRRRAALSSGSGTPALVFSYTVVADDMDDDGIWFGVRTARSSSTRGTRSWARWAGSPPCSPTRWGAPRPATRSTLRSRHSRATRTPTPTTCWLLLKRVGTTRGRVRCPMTDRSERSGRLWEARCLWKRPSRAAMNQPLGTAMS